MRCCSPRRGEAIRRLGAGALAVALAGCAGCATRERPELRPALSFREWSRRRASFSEIRGAIEAQRPYALRVRASIREPRTGHAFEARGAVAVSPHRAARLVLVGPGGGTAIDAWVTPMRWRLAIPPVDFVRRGGTDTDAAHGLPVGFFRWWFLAPFDGALIMSDAVDTPRFAILRDGRATVEMFVGVSDGKALVSAVRREAGAIERLQWWGSSGGPGEGDRAVYVQEPSGLRVDVDVEGVGGEPEPEAFADPDAAGAGS
jgi:hypothetical protein